MSPQSKNGVTSVLYESGQKIIEIALWCYNDIRGRFDLNE